MERFRDGKFYNRNKGGEMRERAVIVVEAESSVVELEEGNKVVLVLLCFSAYFSCEFTDLSVPKF